MVETATLEYRLESDQLGRFLKEGCTNGPKERASGKELYRAYVDWCATNAAKPESNNVFAKALENEGPKRAVTRKRAHSADHVMQEEKRKNNQRKQVFQWREI